jgi:gliding motility-associated lipoprotein GldH
VTDETHAYNLLTGLRITSEYAYSNIWMLYSLKGPNGYFRKDQFQLVLSDNIGRWKGKGVSNLISYQEPFLNQLQLKKGRYTLTIFQNMRDENLESVNNLGLQVVRGQLIL